MARKGNNIYHRKDLRWEGRYHKGRKANGQIKYGYVYGKTYEEVKRKLGPLRRHAQITLELYGNSVVEYYDWSLTWLSEQQKVVKPATYTSYLSKLRKCIWPQLGNLSLYQLDQKAIEGAIAAWQGNGLALSSIKVVLRILSQSLKYAIKKDLLQRNPCEAVVLPKQVQEKVHALTRREQKRLETTALAEQDTRAKAVVLAMETGLRIGEIAALKWEAVDLNRRVLVVKHTFQRVLSADGKQTELQLGAPKTHSSLRVVPMTSKLHGLLLELKKEAQGEFVFSTKGKPCEPRLLTYHFHRVRKKARLEGIHFHQLRHTFATRCLESTIDPLNVSKLLGHASPQLTTSVYYDSMMEQRVAVIAAMEDALKTAA